MNDGPFRTPAPGAVPNDSFPEPPKPPESPPYPPYIPPPPHWSTLMPPEDPPLTDVPVPPSFTSVPLTPDEVDFWKAVYIASVGIERSGEHRASAADKAVLRLRKRRK